MVGSCVGAGVGVSVGISVGAGIGVSVGISVDVGGVMVLAGGAKVMLGEIGCAGSVQADKRRASIKRKSFE